MAKKYDLTFIRGDTEYFYVGFSDPNISVNDYDCWFTVKSVDDSSNDDSTALYQASTDNGLVTRDSDNNKLVIKFDSSGLNSGKYKYDIQIKNINSNDVTTVMYGFLELSDDVTKSD